MQSNAEYVQDFQSKFEPTPHGFTKAIHKIYGYDYDFTKWRDSKEYKLFLHGKSCALEELKNDIDSKIKYME